MDNQLTLYLAGKVSKNSSFGTHHWRDNFCQELSRMSGKKLFHLDPLEQQNNNDSSWDIFSKDCKLITQADALIVYLSDDISVGGSQEILIAKYFGKPVIGFAPYGGKFNGSEREMHGEIIKNYQDPFVFTTCDVVCGTIEEVADAIKRLRDIKVAPLNNLLDQAVK